MFVDEITLKVQAGKGGDGCTSFRREKFVPLGGPDGGNGGKGSDIVFKVDFGLKTLLDLRIHRFIKGLKGGHGSSKNKNGKNANDIIIKVPPGTIIKDLDKGLLMADLINKDETFVVAYGGRGGKGNKAFATASNPAPYLSEHGEEGETKNLKIELKLLADVGLVGLPNVGKSTLLSKISAAKPKIANYHFTTLNPNLGVVSTLNKQSFIVADLPGLIAGASQGQGLGDRFLKHIERTKIIVHLLDMSGDEGRDPYLDYLTINQELASFSPSLAKKPQLLVANKMDKEESVLNLKKLKTKIKLPIYEISALNNEGLDNLIEVITRMLKEITNNNQVDDEVIDNHVLYQYQKESPFEIKKIGNDWQISGREVERLFKMTKFSSDEAILRFTRKLKKMGVDDKLKELGAKDGDLVKILDYEFEFIN